MKKKERRMILLLVIIGIIIIAVLVNMRNKKNNTNGGNVGTGENIRGEVVGEFVEVLEDGTKQNTSDKLAQTKTFGNYEISNIHLTVQDGQSLLVGDVKNIGSEKANVTNVEVTLLEKGGKEIKTITGVIGDVEPGQTVPLSIANPEDFANAYDFTIKAMN